MENTNQNSEGNKTLAYISDETIMTIEVSGQYLGKLKILFYNICSAYTNEKLTELLQKYKDDVKPETPDEYMIDILLPLISSLEKAAVDQKLIKERIYTPEDIAKLKNEISGS
jgi:hypothetical protein